MEIAAAVATVVDLAAYLLDSNARVPPPTRSQPQLRFLGSGDDAAPAAPAAAAAADRMQRPGGAHSGHENRFPLAR